MVLVGVAVTAVLVVVLSAVVLENFPEGGMYALLDCRVPCFFCLLFFFVASNEAVYYFLHQP